MAVSSEVLLADIEARPNVTGTLLIDATDAKILSATKDLANNSELIASVMVKMVREANGIVLNGLEKKAGPPSSLSRVTVTMGNDTHLIASVLPGNKVVVAKVTGNLV